MDFGRPSASSLFAPFRQQKKLALPRGSCSVSMSSENSSMSACLPSSCKASTIGLPYQMCKQLAKSSLSRFLSRNPLSRKFLSGRLQSLWIHLWLLFSSLWWQLL